MTLSKTICWTFLAVALSACDDGGGRGGETGGQDAGQPAETAPPAALDLDQIENLLGIAGVRQDGRYKVAVPQHELAVTVDGFRIIPPMGLTSWAAFGPAPGGAVVMGDLVLQEDEIGPMEKTLVDSGLSVSGLHNHFVRDQPKTMFMHIHGVGPQEQLARGVSATLDRIRDLRRGKNLTGGPEEVNSSFDPEVIDSILGQSGEMNSGVYKVTIGRPDVELTDHGARVTSFMGFNSWMAFQGTADRAAVCGDFAMLEHEVPAVIEALVRNDIEVVAVHNHMVSEEPRIFFLHFWGVGPVDALARGLKAGLDQTGPGNQVR